MEKKFDMPTLNVVVFENEDVITASFTGYITGLFSTPHFNPFGE